MAVNPITQFQKAADSERKSDLAQIQRAIEAYYQDFGRYPQSTGAYTIDENLDPTITDEIQWGTGWAPYIDVLPAEDAADKNYVYYSDPADGQSYWLYASIDRGQEDPDACNNGDACLRLSTLSITDTACGGICNYGISSPNVSP